jgi:hypothetical protein
MDFGLVWLFQEEGGREVISIDAARGGTISYMAPEQARGERMDARGDLFSLGCILYEAITGEPPYPARTRRELIEAHARPPVPPSQLASGVSSELDALTLGLLERNPRDRIGHASDVAAALADLGARTAPMENAPAAKAYLYRPELVGRGALLDAALAGLKEKRGSLTLVAGESGIGKTSFAAEVARRAGAQGVRVVTCECVAVGLAAGQSVRQGGPFYPLARLLQAVGDRCIADGAPMTTRMLAERAKVLAATEPSLRDLPGADAYPEPAEVPAEAARRRMIDAMAETLSAFAADRPTLLVIDDLQWADDLTLAFLGSLSAHYYVGNPIFILGTYRSEESTPDIERIVTAPHVGNLRLDRLDAPTIGTMSADMLGQRHLSDEVVTFLSTASSGNPFFVAEYLRAAVDAGLLFRDERGRWQLTGGAREFDTLSLPRNLQALVARRLEGLTEPARRLTELASVLGREVEIDVLTALALDSGVASDEGALDEVLLVLLVRQVLEAASAGSVRFVHDKLREIAYERLSADGLRDLHKAAGLLLERRHTQNGTLERGAASLAYHFDKAGDVAKAVAYFDQAGEAAHRMHANREAFRLLGKARTLQQGAALAMSPVAAARRERMLGLDALALGNIKEALARLTEAASTAGHAWPSSRAALVARCLGSLGGEVLRRWTPWLTRGPGLEPDDRELLLEAARAHERLAVVNYMATGDLTAVVYASAASLGLAERAGVASGELALGYASFASMCSLMTLDSVAQSYSARATRVAREAGDAVAESWVLVHVGVVNLNAGRWQANRDALEQVRVMARRMGFSRRWEEGTSQLSTACLLRGSLDESETLNNELAGDVERADPQTQCWTVVRRAELALLRGDSAGALAAAREGRRLCEQGLGFAEWIFATGPLAIAQLRLGDRPAAREAADLCAEWAAKGSAPVLYTIIGLAATAEVYLALAESSADPVERKTLAQAARRAVKRLHAAGRAIRVAAPRAAFWRGMMALKLDGQRARALKLLRQSAKRARELEMPYDEALALAAIGEHATDAGEKARLLDDAAGILARIGAKYDLDRVERLRAPG